MKQFKNTRPKTACMFFSVDQEEGKILAMSCVPKVCVLYCILPFYKETINLEKTVLQEDLNLG